MRLRSASVNFATESTHVTAPAGISDDDLLAAVARAGYTARLKSGLAPAAPTATSSPSIREAAAHKLDKTTASPAVPTASNSTASPLANSADSPQGPAGAEPARAGTYIRCFSGLFTELESSNRNASSSQITDSR